MAENRMENISIVFVSVLPYLSLITVFSLFFDLSLSNSISTSILDSVVIYFILTRALCAAVFHGIPATGAQTKNIW